jgi:hypothetical protein
MRMSKSRALEMRFVTAADPAGERKRAGAKNALPGLPEAGQRPKAATKTPSP